MFYIKFRKVGEKAWTFLTSDGYGNRLRIHAARYLERDKAEREVEYIPRLNPGVEAKLVEVAS